MGTLKELLKIKPDFEYNKLPKGFKAKWIKALNSDKYIQGSGALITVDNVDNITSHCCLGVAANICEIGNSHLFGYGTLDDLEANGKERRIPKELRINDPLNGKLATFNDTGYTFKQIARWIEKYL